MTNTQKISAATKQKCTDSSQNIKVHANQIERLIDVTLACQQGLFILTNAEQGVHARAKVTKALIPFVEAKTQEHYKKQLGNFEKELEKARKIQGIAIREKDSDYSLLFSFALISLWSILESMSKEFLASWIRANPKLLRAEKISNVKVTLGDYEPLSASERIKHIIFLMDRSIGGDNRSGIKRFENIFSLFELGESIPKQLAKDIYEFQQVRNSLAHDGFVSGKQLRAACPWLFKNNRKKTFSVTGDMFFRYALATSHYCHILQCRALEFTGEDKTESVSDTFKAYNEEYTKN